MITDIVLPKKVPIPLRIIISYAVKDINNKKIENYESEILVKKDRHLKDSLHDLKTQLDMFCEECEGSLEAIINHQLDTITLGSTKIKK